MSDGKTWAKPLAAALAALVVVVALAACGDSDGSTEASSSEGRGGSVSAGLERAEANVEQHRAEVTKFTPPGPSIDAASLSGKSIWYIPTSASIPVLSVEQKGIEEAVEGLGMSYRTCDGKFTPAAASTCITQAANASAAGIIIDSIEPETVVPALATAKSKGVPVMGFQLAGTDTDAIRFISGGDLESHLVAMNWIIADSEGEANILASSVEGAKSVDEQIEGAEAVLNENCPDCSFTTAQVTAAQIQQIPAAVSSALLKDPDVDYGFPQYDFFVPLFQRGMQQAGRTSGMSVVSTNSALSQMQQVASGSGQVADVGANRNYLGWETVDGILRMSLDEPPPDNVTIPVRVFDKTNIDSVELTDSAAESGEWWGPTDYKTEFLKLWGVG